MVEQAHRIGGKGETGEAYISFFKSVGAALSDRKVAAFVLGAIFSMLVLGAFQWGDVASRAIAELTRQDGVGTGDTLVAQLAAGEPFAPLAPAVQVGPLRMDTALHLGLAAFIFGLLAFVFTMRSVRSSPVSWVAIGFSVIVVFELALRAVAPHTVLSDMVGRPEGVAVLLLAGAGISVLLLLAIGRETGDGALAAWARAKWLWAGVVVAGPLLAAMAIASGADKTARVVAHLSDAPAFLGVLKHGDTRDQLLISTAAGGAVLLDIKADAPVEAKPISIKPTSPLMRLRTGAGALAAYGAPSGSPDAGDIVDADTHGFAWLAQPGKTIALRSWLGVVNDDSGFSVPDQMQGGAHAIALSPDGLTLAVAGEGGDLRLHTITRASAGEGSIVVAADAAKAFARPPAMMAVAEGYVLALGEDGQPTLWRNTASELSPEVLAMGAPPLAETPVCPGPYAACGLVVQRAMDRQAAQRIVEASRQGVSRIWPQPRVMALDAPVVAESRAWSGGSPSEGGTAVFLAAGSASAIVVRAAGLAAFATADLPPDAPVSAAAMPQGQADWMPGLFDNAQRMKLSDRSAYLSRARNGTGAQDPMLRFIMQGLARLDLYTGAQDGQFGAAVENAVKALQARGGLEQSGVVDDDTFALMCRQLDDRGLAQGAALVALGREDGFVEIWRAATTPCGYEPQRIAVVGGFSDRISQLYFAAGDTKLVAASWDGRVRVIDIEAAAHLHALDPARLLGGVARVVEGWLGAKRESTYGGTYWGDDVAPASSPTPERKPARDLQISDAGVALIKSFETYSRTARLDGSGMLIVGYGHTKGVTKATTMTEAQAEAALREDIAPFAQQVRQLVTVDLTQGEFDALVSFTFNAGANNLRGSTILKALNADDRAGAAEGFATWASARGRMLPGLVERRTAERAMFLGEPAAAPTTSSTASLSPATPRSTPSPRVTLSPPDPAQPVDLGVDTTQEQRLPQGTSGNSGNDAGTRAIRPSSPRPAQTSPAMSAECQRLTQQRALIAASFQGDPATVFATIDEQMRRAKCPVAPSTPVDPPAPR